jgi:hypothetical protein
LINDLDKSKVGGVKLAEWGTASHVEKHMPLPQEKPATSATMPTAE